MEGSGGLSIVATPERKRGGRPSVGPRGVRKEHGVAAARQVDLPGKVGKEQRSMAVFIMLTRLAHGALHSPEQLEKLERTLSNGSRRNSAKP